MSVNLPAMTSNRAQQLEELYAEIHRWALKTDPRLVRRKVIERSLEARVVLTGQALARDTQRLSGLPYTFPDGRASAGGRELARFLNGFGHSIDPGSDLSYAHSTDLVPAFPGRNPSGSGDRKPTRREISECAGWLDREIEIIGPEVIVLLGALPARAFLERCAAVSAPKLRDVAGGATARESEASRWLPFPSITLRARGSSRSRPPSRSSRRRSRSVID